MSTASLDLSKLIVNGRSGSKHHANVLDAVTSMNMRETITGASTVEITLQDEHRKVLRSVLAGTRSTIQLDGAGFELAATSKSGTSLTLTFEDMAVAALRRKHGARAVAGNIMSRAQFCATLAREVSWIKVAAAPGAKSLVQLARGSGVKLTTSSSGDVGGWGDYGTTSVAPTTPKTSTSTTTASGQVSREGNESRSDDEDSWAAIGRILGEINWRACVVRGVLYLAPDSFLIDRARDAYALTEASKGVDNIDFDWDIGKPAATATLTVWAGIHALAAGSPVSLSKMGPANGKWLVETIERSPFTKLCTVSLVRPQPTLPEPRDLRQDATSDIGEGGWGLPVDIGGSGPGAGSGSIADRFVNAALSQNGKPYVWGGSGPNSFDCSGLVQWAARKVGVSFPKPVLSMLGNCRRIPIADAVSTRGALLLRRGDPNHVAISLGNGKTIEARGKAYGVGQFSATSGRSWTTGGLIPGIPPDGRVGPDRTPIGS